MFISYRWGRHDAAFVQALFDMLTNFTLGENLRAVWRCSWTSSACRMDANSNTTSPPRLHTDRRACCVGGRTAENGRQLCCWGLLSWKQRLPSVS